MSNILQFSLPLTDKEVIADYISNDAKNTASIVKFIKQASYRYNGSFRWMDEENLIPSHSHYAGAEQMLEMSEKLVTGWKLVIRRKKLLERMKEVINEDN